MNNSIYMFPKPENEPVKGYAPGSPERVEIRKALDEGRFGKLVSVSAKQLWFRDESYYKSASWRGTWAVDGGGALMNQGSHTVDLLLYLGGEVKKISAHTANILHKIEVEDSAFAQIDYVCGASGTLEVSTACKPGYPVTIEVTGTTGSAILKADTLAHNKLDSKVVGTAKLKKGTKIYERPTSSSSKKTISKSCKVKVLKVYKGNYILVRDSKGYCAFVEFGDLNEFAK